jgi:hypothetical protein
MNTLTLTHALGRVGAARPTLRILARRAAPVLAMVAVVAILASPVYAQSGGQVGEPSTQPIDAILTRLRNFFITLLLPIGGAIAIGWAVVMAWQGGREGVGNVVKVVGMTLLGLAAVGVIELLKAWADNRAR